MIDLSTDLDYPEPKKQPLVISHSPCLDGFTAAWACWLIYPDAEFVPGIYGQPPPDCTGRDVYLLDYSYKRAVMEKICAEANSVLVLDHHKSAQEDLVGLDNWLDGDTVNVVFDMEKSGARLAWEYFHPGTEVPLFVRLVEDRDLWRFALPDSKALNAAFFSYDYSFEQWNELCIACDTVGLLALTAEGEAIERKQAKDVKELVAKMRRTLRFSKLADAVDDGVRITVPAVNLPYTLASDAGNLLAQDAPFAAVYYQNAAGGYEFSLRSVEGGMDVSAVAVRYGGGGHKHAAGFRIASLDEL